MIEPVQHEQYRGHDIRSCPLQLEGLRKAEDNQKWKVGINITPPEVRGAQTTSDLPDGEPYYPTQKDAHKAGFERGRRHIDELMAAPSN